MIKFVCDKIMKKAEIINSALDGIPELSIVGDIGLYSGSDIAYSIRSTDSKTLRININSFGGSVLGGYEIISAMTAYKNAGGTIETVVTGRADSTAGWIASCGTKKRRKIMQFGGMFFHPPMLSDGRTLNDLAKDSEEYKELNNVFSDIVSIFSGCTDRTEGAIRSIMLANTDYSASDAVRAGFVDSIVSVRVSPDLSNCTTRAEMCEIINSSKIEIIENKTDMRKIAEMLNLNADASEASVIEAVSAIKKTADDFKNKSELLASDLAEANAKIGSLSDELAGIKDRAVIEYVDQLIAVRPEIAENKEAVVNMAKLGFETFKKMNPISVAVVVNQAIDGDIDETATQKEAMAQEFANMSIAERESLKNTDYAKYTNLVTAYEGL